jgi:hypothetical protein
MNVSVVKVNIKKNQQAVHVEWSEQRVFFLLLGQVHTFKEKEETGVAEL